MIDRKLRRAARLSDAVQADTAALTDSPESGRRELIADIDTLLEQTDAKEREVYRNFARVYLETAKGSRRQEWRNQLLRTEVTPTFIAFLINVLAHTDELLLKSDILYCLQEQLGVDMLIVEGAILSAEAARAFEAQIHASLRPKPEKEKS